MYEEPYGQWSYLSPWAREVRLDPKMIVKDIERTLRRDGWRVAWIQMCLYLRDVMRNPDHWGPWSDGEV